MLAAMTTSSRRPPPGWQRRLTIYVALWVAGFVVASAILWLTMGPP
jgi:hypothetical protein